MSDSQPTSASDAPGTAPGASSGSAAAAAAAQAKARRVSDGAKAPILPDCCNLGIALRIVVAFNVAGLLLALGLGAADGEPLARLLEVAALLEPALLLSMALVCAVRRRVNGLKIQQQWAIGLALPVVVSVFACGVVGHSILPAAPAGSFALWLLVRAAAALALAWLTIEFFRLRALSFSPSLSEARLQALQARIRPHFLFNSLNTVLGLMRGNPRLAEHTLENLSDLFRVFMKDTRELVPLDDEIIVCQQYLAIEQLRLGERLTTRLELDEMPGDALLPSLLLQPLVENAVHHGIEPRTEPGEIMIRITKPAERVRVEIVNPTSEQQPTRPGNQMALSNVRERLMLLYDMEAELKTTEEGGQYTLVLEIPYRKERRRRDVRRHFNPYR